MSGLWTSIVGFMHAFFDYAKVIWIMAVLAFMLLSIVVGIIQHVRKKELWDAPWPLITALVVLLIVGGVSGLGAAFLYFVLLLLGVKGL